jgi:hypothetical protein
MHLERLELEVECLGQELRLGSWDGIHEPMDLCVWCRQGGGVHTESVTAALCELAQAVTTACPAQGVYYVLGLQVQGCW